MYLLQPPSREELVAYYGKLSQDAQLRQMRAVWQSQRLALSGKRKALLMGEEGGGMIHVCIVWV